MNSTSVNQRWTWPLILIALASAWLLFYRLDALPLRLWDEGRRAVNALEMSTGESHLLVPTFAGAPDHWGTKPPLLVWLQASTMKVLGPTILAVRLPATLAALGTCLWLLWFSRRQLKNPLAGMAACLTMLCVPFYMGSHAARAGDFDALLICWLTGGILSLFVYLEERNRRFLWLASGCLALAFWTKGIAAGFFLPGIALWILVYKPHRWVMREPAVYIGIIVPILSLLAYYLIRNQLDPGYLQLVWENELGGRYTKPLEGHRGDALFYVRQLFWRPAEQPWGIVLLLSTVIPITQSRWHAIWGYLLLLIGGLLLIVSSAQTKLLWYAMPLVPLLGLLAGLTFASMVQLLVQRIPMLGKPLVGTLLLLLVAAYPYYQMGKFVSKTKHGPDYSSTTVYGRYLPQITEAGPYTLLLPSYNPHAIFHAEVMQQQGQEVDIIYLKPPPEQVHSPTLPLSTFSVGSQVVVCEMDTWVHMDERYTFDRDYAISPCVLLRIK